MQTDNIGKCEVRGRGGWRLQRQSKTFRIRWKPTPNHIHFSTLEAKQTLNLEMAYRRIELNHG